MDEEIFSLQKMQVVSWVYLVVLTLGAWLLKSWSFAWPVLAGGVISIVSFISSHKDVMNFVESLTPAIEEEKDKPAEEKTKTKQTKTGFIIRFWLRIIVIGILLLLLIKSAKANVFGLIIGLSTMVFTITFTAVSVARRYFFR